MSSGPWESSPRGAMIAALGLSTRFGPPEGPLTDGVWTGLLAEARVGRLYGFLVSEVESGRFPATEAQQEELRLAHASQVCHELELERDMLATATMLESRRIPYRLMKGAAAAHSVYSDPRLRSFGDLDVLIHRRSYDDAVAALEERGYRHARPELRPGFDGRFGKGGMLVTVSDHQLDLHSSFVVGALGILVDPDDLFVNEREVTIGGRSVSVLPPEELFLQSCYAAVLADRPPAVRYSRDVAEILLHCDLDIDRVIGLATSWSARPVVALAVQQAWATLGIDTGHELLGWARALRATRRERLLLEAHRRYGHTAAEVAGVAVLPGLRARISYVAALALPSAGYREAMGRTPFGHLREAGHRLLTQPIRRNGRES